jgi:hypothetical protein
MAVGRVHLVCVVRHLAAAIVASNECIVFEWFDDHTPSEGDEVTGFLEASGAQLLYNATQDRRFSAHIHAVALSCERAEAFIQNAA